MSQKEEKKLVSLLQTIFENNLNFKNFDDFLKNLFTSHISNKNMSLDSQKQFKNDICDILMQVKGKRIVLQSKEISRLLLIIYKKLPSFDFINSFEYELALDVIFFIFYKCTRD